MIEGINVRCNVGGYQVLRSPRISLTYRRRAVVTRGEIDIPDPDGGIRAGLALGQAVRLRFGLRGEAALWHDWQGTIDGLDQAGPDLLRVLVVGLDRAILDTTVTESYHGEPAATVARRLLAATGLPVGSVDIPGDVLPHIVLATVPVSRAIRQLAHSLERAMGHDLCRHALWLGAGGLTWSDGDEPGDVITIATAENLIDHAPATKPGGLSRIVSTLLPGLTHSRRVRLRDTRRGISGTVRALEVEHLLEQGRNTTTILYGDEHGWC